MMNYFLKLKNLSHNNLVFFLKSWDMGNPGKNLISRGFYQYFYQKSSNGSCFR
jgi:hypothetical protein